MDLPPIVLSVVGGDWMATAHMMKRLLTVEIVMATQLLNGDHLMATTMTTMMQLSDFSD